MFDQKNVSVVFDLVAPGQGYGRRRFPRHRPTIPHSGENSHRDEGHDLKTTVEIVETPPAAVPISPLAVGVVRSRTGCPDSRCGVDPPPTPHRRAPCTHAGPPPLGRRAVVLAPVEGPVWHHRSRSTTFGCRKTSPHPIRSFCSNNGCPAQKKHPCQRRWLSIACSISEIWSARGEKRSWMRCLPS